MKKHKKEVKEIKLILGNGIIYEKGKEPVQEGYTFVESLTLDKTPLKLKYKDNSVDEIQCSHVLQYLDGKHRMEYLDEIWRVLKLNCKVICITPFWSSSLSIFDPLYKWPPISENSYLVFNKAWRETAGRKHYPIKCNFECPGNYGYSGIDGDYAGRNQEYVERAVKHELNAVQDLQVVLTKLG